MYTVPVADALVVIDIQNEYFPGGNLTLPDAEAAAGRAGAAIAAARAAGVPVIHIQHEEPDSQDWFVPGSHGAEINPAAAPVGDELVIVKHQPNSFLKTDLAQRLERLGATRVAFCGMMTSMCVDATVRAAADLGVRPVLIDDACAAPDLEHRGARVPAAAVHAAFCGALGDEIATLVPSGDFASAPADA
ncbi:MAG: cysteine hydrolase family protein [Solirubrobacteraceae bacterium]